MITLKSMYENLDYWALNNMASDIYECRSMRPEYQLLVRQAESFGFTEDLIVKYALLKLKDQVELPWYRRDLRLAMFIFVVNLKHLKLQISKKLIFWKIKIKSIID